MKEIRKAGGAHVALVCSAAKAAYDAAFNSVRPTGTLLAVGLPAESICFPPIMMAARKCELRLPLWALAKTFAACWQWPRLGKLHCDVISKPLEFANEALELLRTGQVSGRIVLTFPG